MAERGQSGPLEEGILTGSPGGGLFDDRMGPAFADSLKTENHAFPGAPAVVMGLANERIHHPDSVGSDPAGERGSGTGDRKFGRRIDWRVDDRGCQPANQFGSKVVGSMASGGIDELQ